MSFRPPDFNLLCNIWFCDGNVSPAGGSPDLVDIPVQKYISSRAAWPVSPPWAKGFFLQYHPPVQLRFARVYPFDGGYFAWKVTCVEVPEGSGQYYRTFWGDVQHEGFPNEYALLIAVQCEDDLTAVPPPGSTEIVGIGDDACGNRPAQDTIIDNIPGGLNCCAGGTPPPPVFLFEDTFVGTGGDPILSHVANTGETYTGDPYGILALQNSPDGLHDTDNTGTGAGRAVADYAGPADGLVRLTWTTGVFGSPLTTNVGVLYRSVDSDNTWALILLPDGLGQWFIEIDQFVSGTGSPKANSVSFSLSDNTQYELVVDLIGNDITGEIQHLGTSIANVLWTDASGSADTGVGVYLYRDSFSDDPVITHLTKE